MLTHPPAATAGDQHSPTEAVKKLAPPSPAAQPHAHDPAPKAKPKAGGAPPPAAPQVVHKGAQPRPHGANPVVIQQSTSQRRNGKSSSRTMSVSFLEDQPPWFQARLNEAYDVLMDKGKPVMLASMGRLGAKGLATFVLAMREKCAIADTQADVRLSLIRQPDSVPFFGSPVLLLMTPTKSRLFVPSEWPWLTRTIRLHEHSRHEAIRPLLLEAMGRLQRGQHVRLEMTGADTIQKGLRLVATAGQELQAEGGSFSAVPEAEGPQSESVRLYVFRMGFGRAGPLGQN